MDNSEFTNIALLDYIKRMLVYYDPISVMSLGAPKDEYDRDAERILRYLNSRSFTQEDLSQYIFSNFLSDDLDPEELKDKATRMSSDLVKLIKGK